VRPTIGCAGILAIIAFALVFAGMSLFGHTNLQERAFGSAMTAALTFVASLLLFLRDQQQFIVTKRKVREKLLTRTNLGESVFLSKFPISDTITLANTRIAVAKFFDVPPEKIYPDDNLCVDLLFDKLEPAFHSFVANSVFIAQNLNIKSFWFRTAGLVNINDLAVEIQQAIDRSAQNKA
jgi:hypothetical protein